MREFKEKGKDENHTKGMLVAKEQAILKDLIAEHKKCKCGSDKNLSLDHIIPLDILRSFMDVKREMLEGNYQLLCYRCNIFKANKLDFSNPETKKLLLDLIEKL